MKNYYTTIIDNKVVTFNRFGYIRLELKKLQAIRTKNIKQFGEYAANYHYDKKIKQLRNQFNA
jgi:hypothetical protein